MTRRNLKNEVDRWVHYGQITRVLNRKEVMWLIQGR